MTDSASFEPIVAMPVARTPLVGRAAEIAAARSLIVDTAVPLLTLTGPGGVGKTRLALAIAEDLAKSFADGRIFVDLAPIRDPSHVWMALAQTLGLRDREEHSPDLLVATFLMRRQVLLILDNCEHLPSLAPDVGKLLSRCPAVQILATSRAPLRVRGEHLRSLQPLALPAADEPIDVDAIARIEAIDLFLQRGRAVSPAFCLTTRNAMDVAEICRRLDGLPLAIELAAARLRHLSPDALLLLLADRLRVLTGGERDAPTRQQTLRDAIAWSYDLLSADEQRVFRRLGVFVGGFDMNAALTVGGSAASNNEAIVETLVDQSLIQRDARSNGTIRFRMLETVREFALEGLTHTEEVNSAQQAHAAFFQDLTERAEGGVYGSDPGSWLDSLEVEYPNCRAALEYFAAVGDSSSESWMASFVAEYWQNRGRHSEGIACLSDVLERGRQAAPIPRAKAMIDLSLLVRDIGDCDRALELTTEAERLARTASVDRRLAQVLYVRAWNIESCREAWNEVVPLLEEALELLTAANPGSALQTATLADLGWARMRLGDATRGRRLIEDALEIGRSESQLYSVDKSLTMLGLLDQKAGNESSAADRYQQALEMSGKNRFTLRTIYPLAGLAGLTMGRGNPEWTARILGMIDAIWEHTGAGSPTPRLEKWQAIADGAGRDALALLGADAFSAGVGAGHALPFEAAITEGLSIAKALATGTTLTSVAAVSPHVSPPREPSSLPDGALTRREREVLTLLVERWTAPEIADQLFLSVRTVEGHVASIYGKLGVSSRRDASAAALQHGLIDR